MKMKKFYMCSNQRNVNENKEMQFLTSKQSMIFVFIFWCLSLNIQQEK